MSTLLGSPGDRWSLAQAVDALAASARRAGTPGLIWIVGFLYPSLNINVDLMRSLLALIQATTGIAIPGATQTAPIVFLFAPQGLPSPPDTFGKAIGMMLLLMPVIFLVYRLIVGLAFVSDPSWGGKTEVLSAGESQRVVAQDRQRFSIGDAWRAGKGLGPFAFGLWLMLLGLLLGTTAIVLGPLVMIVHLIGLTEFSFLFAGLLLPLLLFLLPYAIILMVLNQLAMHSLAHNRRGVASALTHAWRLIRAAPLSAARATLVDFVLFVSVLVVGVALASTLGAMGAFAWLQPFVLVALYGFVGVTRAGYWARAYRALGGLSTIDEVPGL